MSDDYDALNDLSSPLFVCHIANSDVFRGITLKSPHLSKPGGEMCPALGWSTIEECRKRKVALDNCSKQALFQCITALKERLQKSVQCTSREVR